MSVPGPPLLDPASVRELEALRRRLEVRARSGQGGDHLSKRRGSSVEFREHRTYEPGDDLRRIDWGAYARTGEPMIKVFRSEEDVVVRFLCDASASMSFGDPSKLEFAQRLAAAVGYMVLARSERAQVLSAADGLVSMRAPNKGRAGLAGFLSSLEQLRPNGETNLSKAIDDTLKRSPRPGLLIVISDFFDPSPVIQSLKQAVFAGHQVSILQVLAREELEPIYDGDLALIDAETGAEIEVTMDVGALEAYRRRLQSLSDSLADFARKHRASYGRHSTSDSIVEAVRHYVERGARA
jgi:uncharacterized protein (DUF58 family)